MHPEIYFTHKVKSNDPFIKLIKWVTSGLRCPEAWLSAVLQPTPTSSVSRDDEKCLEKYDMGILNMMFTLSYLFLLF